MDKYGIEQSPEIGPHKSKKLDKLDNTKDGKPYHKRVKRSCKENTHSYLKKKNLKNNSKAPKKEQIIH